MSYPNQPNNGGYQDEESYQYNQADQYNPQHEVPNQEQYETPTRPAVHATQDHHGPYRVPPPPLQYDPQQRLSQGSGYHDTNYSNTNYTNPVVPSINISNYNNEMYNTQQQYPYQEPLVNSGSPERQSQSFSRLPSPIRPLTNAYRSPSLRDPFNIDTNHQHASGAYLSPTESDQHYNYEQQQPALSNPQQDPNYYYATNRDHEQEYFSALNGVNRSNSTLRFAEDNRYVDTAYAPSINQIDEENAYNQSYGMHEMSELNVSGAAHDANMSNTNIPFISHELDNGFYSNLFEPYTREDDDDPIENDFTPFPVTGEQYEINAYGGPNLSEDDVSYETTDEDSLMADKHPMGSTSSVLDEYYQDPRFGEEVEEPPEGDIPRRSKSTRGIKVKMIDGNLILDCEVSNQLLSKYPNPVTLQDREFKYMRYQAATCDPADFAASKFSLRQLCYFQPRQTEIMVVITMYNEDDVLLARTLQGVFKNIKYLTSRTNSSTWGKDSWKKIVVCIVSDGRTKINPRSQLLLALLGVYQEGFAKNMVNDKPVVGHIYEYTTMVGISKITEGQVKLTTQKTVPVQLLFCLKEKNQKKINSHRWCFQAFAPILNPNVVVLLDAGTQPASDSIYHLWKLFDKDHSVAGACGEIRALLNPKWYLMLWEMIRKPIVYLQNFEYKTSNILDKPMESVFGFVTVLPGAFSAYRYVALQNDVNGVGPLLSYFKGETLHNSDSGLFTANMYLAEDRILCWELVAKKDCNWILKYVKLASAKTDVPEQLPEFILQRRRWLNGSFFAAIYSLVHFYNIYRSSHSIFRMFFFHIQFIYQTLNLLVSWFSLASYFLVFRILTVNLGDTSLHMARVGNILSVLFLWLYLASVVTTFVLSFGNKPKGTKRFYVVIVWFFAVLMAYMIFAAVYMSYYAVRDIILQNGGTLTFAEAFQSSRFRDLVVATISTYALYFVGAFIAFDPWHMFTSFIQYILLSPAYINVLNIYAFCNIHDISWGTKGDTGVKMDLGVAKQSSTEGKFFIEIPTTNQEVDDAYTRQIDLLLNPQEHKESEPDADEVEKDYYLFIRSMTVLFWMVSNFVIIAVVLETGGINQLGGRPVSTDAVGLSTNSEIFLTVILWIVAFMLLFRFVGCVLYLLLRLVGK